MRFASRADPAHSVAFREALFSGLAPDGGLYHPVGFPDLGPAFARMDDGTSFAECAAVVAAAILAPDLDARRARQLASQAFDFPVTLRRLDERILLLELFHGPTCAFKDFGARFLAGAMEDLLTDRDAGTGAGARSRILILVATSGDTGSAVAHAFAGRANIDVAILYPAGRVSDLQEKQLTTLGGNVHAFQVAGSFDDCQRLAKEAFREARLRDRLGLTSANSINVGRLLPQSLYYIFAATRRAELGGTPPVFGGPSGNFGNLPAGVSAGRGGLPVRGFIAATNVNDVVPAYLASGLFSPRASVGTLSNAMDVGDPSNFERLLGAFGGEWSAMAARIEGKTVSDEKTLQTMERVYRDHGVFIDPHTAVGIAAAQEHLAAQGGLSPERRSQLVVLATAHPAKFADTVRRATGTVPDMPERLARCLRLSPRVVRIGTDFQELCRRLLDMFG